MIDAERGRSLFETHDDHFLETPVEILKFSHVVVWQVARSFSGGRLINDVTTSR